MEKCPNCGRALDPNDVYCPLCGQSVVVGARTKPQPTALVLGILSLVFLISPFLGLGLGIAAIIVGRQDHVREAEVMGFISAIFGGVWLLAGFVMMILILFNPALLGAIVAWFMSLWFWIYYSNQNGSSQP